MYHAVNITHQMQRKHSQSEGMLRMLDASILIQQKWRTLICLQNERKCCECCEFVNSGNVEIRRTRRYK